MELRQATWHSKVCPCSFRVEFDKEKPTVDRNDDTDFRCVGRPSHRKILDTSDYSCDVKEISCPRHADMQNVKAFDDCKAMHKEQGLELGIKHMTVNRLRPDTCKCVIEFEFDKREPNDARTIHLGESIEKCKYHADLKDHAHHLAVFQENARKNKVLLHVESFIPDTEEHFKSTEDWDGNVSKTLKFPPRWKHDESRTLHIELHRSHKHLLPQLKASLDEAHPGTVIS